MKTLGPFVLGPNDSIENGIYRGDARELAQAIPDESVDLIFTDPPYDKESLPLFDWLGKFAARVLVPGGTLVTMAGNIYLPNVINSLNAHLDYHWIINIDLLHGGGGNARIERRRVFQFWKPLLWYQKGKYCGRWNSDHLGASSNDKRYHKWGQSLGTALSVLKKFDSAFVLDPFAGSGTFLVAAQMLRRNYLGFEISHSSCITARNRLANTQISFPEIFGEQIEMKSITDPSE